MKALQGLLAVNGAVFLLRAGINLLRPTSFYLEQDAPGYAVDAVRVLGVTYSSLGLIQLAMLKTGDRNAVRSTATASMLFSAGVAIQASAQGSTSSDTFHRIRVASAAENFAVATLYGYLLARERHSVTCR